MLTCMDPRQERLVRGGMRVIERATGLPIGGLLEMAPGLAQIFGREMPADHRISKARILKVSVQGRRAIVRVFLRETTRDHGRVQSKDRTVLFELAHHGGAGWRITRARPG